MERPCPERALAGLAGSNALPNWLGLRKEVLSNEREFRCLRAELVVEEGERSGNGRRQSLFAPMSD